MIFENLDFSQFFCKISILVKFCFKTSILAIFCKISILVKKNSKNLNFGQDLKKKKLLGFCRNFRKSGCPSKFLKFSISVKIFEKKSILVKKKSKILNFCLNFHKSGFWSKFLKILLSVEIFSKTTILIKIFPNLDFGQDFRNISILVKTFEKFYFGENSRKILNVVKIWISVKIFGNLDFGQNFRISRYRSKFSIIVDFGKRNFENFDFGKKFRKIPILVKNFRKSRFPLILEYFDFIKSFRKPRFGLNFRTFQFLIKFSKNLDFSQNFRKISILVEIFEKSRFWSAKYIEWQSCIDEDL